MEPLSVREVAELLGVTPQHVYKMLETNQIPGALSRSGHALQFCPRTLLKWLESKLAG
jgi:excisionase family DNA binding protein